MTPVQFTSVTTDDGEQFLTVFANGRLLPPIDSTHPNFETIKNLCVDSLAGEPVDVDYLVSLFDVAETIAAKFETLSDRIKVANGRLYLDGDEIDNALSKQILRFMDEGVDDWMPLVAFFEKVLANPNEHSRQQLFEWLNRHDFTITEDGDIVGYKGVASDGEGGYQSISSGREQVLVDNEPHTGRIPNPLGATIEMARTLVHHDPATGCSRGLHVGTYEYASSWTSVAEVLEVHVNPRDVVSVPTDCNWQKVRTCRYTVVKPVDAKYGVAVLGQDVDNASDADFDLAIGGEFKVGDKVVDRDYDEGVIIEIGDDDMAQVRYDVYGDIWQDVDDLSKA